jgi:hypothetical protein
MVRFLTKTSASRNFLPACLPACLKKLGTLSSGCNQQNKDRFTRARRKIFKILDPEKRRKKRRDLGGFGVRKS